MSSVERVEHQGNILAIVVRSKFEYVGTTCFTPTDFTLQLMIMVKRKGESAKAHLHRPTSSPHEPWVSRHEILHIISGQVKVELFSVDGQPADQVMLYAGDTILITAGHRISYLKDTKVLEIKEGPYPGYEKDKQFFEA